MLCEDYFGEEVVTSLDGQEQKSQTKNRADLSASYLTARPIKRRCENQKDEFRHRKGLQEKERGGSTDCRVTWDPGGESFGSSGIDGHPPNSRLA